MSIATIDLKIATAYKKSGSLYEKKPSWQEDMDDLLDRMNDLNRYLNTLHSLILTLTFEVERDFVGFKQSEFAPKGIKQIVAISTKMLNAVKKSDLFPGVKTVYYNLKQEVSYLNELAHDRAVGNDLDDDPEMKDIIDATIKAARRALPGWH